MKIDVWYLYHSGFAVAVGDKRLIFDYWKNTPHTGGFAAGIVDSDSIRDKETFFFASHSHGDHYNPAIFNFSYRPAVHYVLSDDIPAREGALMLGANEKRSFEGLEIETFLSTDLGIAFLVTVDGVTIYHAGDLNWWHWDDDTPDEEAAMKNAYFDSIGRLKGKKIDLAIVPVDPRLEKSAFMGIESFDELIGPTFFAPMHFTSNPKVIDELMERDIAKKKDGCLIPFKTRGQKAKIYLDEGRFVLTPGKGTE
ncbi:MAG: MBL fold metallo-hydrolase [Clostridiales bacterium]|jgi:L-ascorbate metabolism protein UlaG (beta-lactamase superfamily)|nr:MBL fold metallo-hydrolase [Clostridiales bacterium]